MVIGARTESDLEAVAGDIRGMGQRALVVPTDVMQADQLQRLADQAMEALNASICRCPGPGEVWGNNIFGINTFHELHSLDQ